MRTQGFREETGRRFGTPGLRSGWWPGRTAEQKPRKRIRERHSETSFRGFLLVRPGHTETCACRTRGHVQKIAQAVSTGNRSAALCDNRDCQCPSRAQDMFPAAAPHAFRRRRATRALLCRPFVLVGTGPPIRTSAARKNLNSAATRPAAPSFVPQQPGSCVRSRWPTAPAVPEESVPVR